MKIYRIEAHIFNGAGLSTDTTGKECEMFSDTSYAFPIDIGFASISKEHLNTEVQNLNFSGTGEFRLAAIGYADEENKISMEKKVYDTITLELENEIKKQRMGIIEQTKLLDEHDELLTSMTGGE